jgi:hypothetical protein
VSAICACHLSTSRLSSWRRLPSVASEPIAASANQGDTASLCASGCVEDQDWIASPKRPMYGGVGDCSAGGTLHRKSRLAIVDLHRHPLAALVALQSEGLPKLAGLAVGGRVRHSRYSLTDWELLFVPARVAPFFPAHKWRVADTYHQHSERAEASIVVNSAKLANAARRSCPEFISAGTRLPATR